MRRVSLLPVINWLKKIYKAFPLQNLNRSLKPFLHSTLGTTRRRRASAFIAVGMFSLTVIVLYQTTLAAPDLSDTWDLALPSDYTYSNGLELESGIAKLKAQSYTTDAATAALYHFDEAGGTNASDASTSANDATLHGGSFTTGSLDNAVSLNGTTDYISAPHTSSLQLGQQQTIEAWAQLDTTFSKNTLDRRYQIVDKGDYQLYLDNETGKLTYELADASATNWTQMGGNDLNNSWDINGKASVNAMVRNGTNIYAGIGVTTGDAEVWQWNGTVWSKIGGGPESVNNSWSAQTYEGVYSLATDGTNIYAGLGSGAGDGEVWRWNGTTWTKIGGDGFNSGWTNYVEQIYSLDYYGGNLYAGIGNSTTDAEVWRWNGTTWTKIGGDGVNTSWNTSYEVVASLIDDGTNLYAGLGSTAGDGEVWRWNGSAWTKIGGDALNGSWDATIETVRTLDYAGGVLYAGIGDTAGDADVWSWNGTAWTKIGGDALNGGWAASTYEYVASFTHDGTNLYAGLASSDGDGEVWRWNGSAWTKIGGDGVNNSWVTAWGDAANALVWDGSTLFTGIYDAGGSGRVYSWNGTTWSLIGGNYVGESWGFMGLATAQVLESTGGYLYAGTGNSAGAATVWRWNGTTWSLIGGQGIKGSWAANTYEVVSSIVGYKGDLYVGLGSTASATDNDAEVWKWDGTSWTKVGGDGVNSSWPFLASHYGEVDALVADKDYLYAGVGIAANDGEVWRWNGSTWTKIGGDSINSGWTNYMEGIGSMAIYNGSLIVGGGRSTGDAEAWKWTGTLWTKIGGTGVNGSWTGYQTIEAMTSYNNSLYVGLGNTTGTAVLWRYDGTSWTKVGGDDVNGSWTANTYERVRAITVYNGDLYIGLGNTTGEGEVWKWDGTSWTKVGGGGVNAGWSGVIEEIEALTSYQGKLYSATGNTANADAAVWSLGNNAYLQSTTSSFDTSWHHIAATYDGSTMKLYVDGTLDSSTSKSITVATSTRKLLIGAGFGSSEFGTAQSRFGGKLDELRLSTIARTSFTTKPYSDSYQTLTPNASIRTSGVWHWDTFSHTQIPVAETIFYRLSNDGGASWLYWDGTGWSTSTNPEFSNTPSVISNNFASFPVTFSGLKWQAVFKSDGVQQLTLDGVSAEATSDTADPSVNPTNIQAFKVSGGPSFTAESWTNGSSPKFTWDTGVDTSSGIYGYCAYLGTDNTADPTTTKGLLGTSQLSTGNHCAFVVSGNSIDLASPGILASALTSSNDSYYLTLRSMDRAGNVTSNSSQFSFKFDNTPPTNPSFITTPSGFINTKEVQISWPTVGASAANDVNSGLAGLQYRIGATGTWYGDAHSGTGDTSDLLANDGTYTTIETPDFANLVEGVNTIYFRTWDQAGNYSPTYVTAALKINTNGAPSEPNNLVALPASSASNSFGFNWDTPTTYVGAASSLAYCYTVNTTPSVNSCSYTAAGSTELTVGPYATQPGANTLYVVARDESGNINYANYATAVFTANTSAPGIPLNTDIVDVSIKNTSNWRLALTWDIPSDTGEGIKQYRVYRSTDGTNFAQVGSSSSTTYIDAGLTQQTYYYRVAACDSTNNCGAQGTIVSELPSGKFTSPASLVSGPDVNDITTKRAVISWSTDRNSDSKVALGTQSGHYSASEIGNSTQTSAHRIELDNLAPGTTYYYKVKWTDEDGNTGISQEYTFTTAPAPTIKEVTVSNIRLDSATISFTTKGATKAQVYFGPGESFGGFKEINTSENESNYDIQLPSLSDGTKYYYIISVIDKEGAEYRGTISSFTTPSRPRISNLRFQPVAGEPTSTQQVTWTTNVPSSSLVVYTLINGTPVESQDSKLVLEHEIIIRGLRDDSQYSLVAQSRDESGNLAVSDAQSFHTALDTRPPEISNIAVESTIRGSGSEARGQIVVSWTTDEPSTSQIAYAEGSNATVFNSKTAEDTRLTTEHIVIVSDLPTSRVFSIRPISRDHADNEGLGDTQTAIIGRSSDSALTVVFNTLRTIFGL